MSQALTFRVLEDIARDLSGDNIAFPTSLDITFRVRSALKDPSLTIDSLGTLVGAEPLMSAKIIRMANSAALNPTGKAIADVRSAIARVGTEAVRTVSFAVAMDQLLKSKDLVAFETLSQRLWEHSTYVAALSRLLARRYAKINADEAMFAGLVHDIGVFYLMSRAVAFPDLMADEAQLYALLENWHDSIGHALLGALGLPEVVLDAVQTHEEPRQIQQLKTLSDVVFVANQIANQFLPWRQSGAGGAGVPPALTDVLSQEDLDEIVAASEEEVLSLKQALGA